MGRGSRWDLEIQSPWDPVALALEALRPISSLACPSTAPPWIYPHSFTASPQLLLQVSTAPSPASSPAAPAPPACPQLPPQRLPAARPTPPQGLPQRSKSTSAVTPSTETFSVEFWCIWFFGVYALERRRHIHQNYVSSLVTKSTVTGTAVAYTPELSMHQFWCICLHSSCFGNVFNRNPLTPEVARRIHQKPKKNRDFQKKFLSTATPAQALVYTSLVILWLGQVLARVKNSRPQTVA